MAVADDHEMEKRKEFIRQIRLSVDKPLGIRKPEELEVKHEDEQLSTDRPLGIRKSEEVTNKEFAPFAKKKKNYRLLKSPYVEWSKENA